MRLKLILFSTVFAVFTFTAFSVSAATPTISSISPATKTAGDAAFTLTVNGNNFLSGKSGTKIYLDGVERATAYVNSNRVTAFIDAEDIANPGTYLITAVNPEPGGGTSGSRTLTVNNPVPTTTGLSETSVEVGTAGFTLSVYGTNFFSTSAVRFNGSSRATTFISSTQLDAAILASDLDDGGYYDITVFNTTPGGGTSGAQTFSVVNPMPIITNIYPLATNQFNHLDLDVYGQNFVPGSQAYFNGSDRDTDYVSAEHLVVDLNFSDTWAEGEYPITVVNPAPGGGTSNSHDFSVVDLLAPIIEDIEPLSVIHGEPAFDLVVNGSRFFSENISNIHFNGLAVPTQHESFERVFALDIAVLDPGVYYVTVVNGFPWGDTSNAAPFTIYNAPPTANSLAVSLEYCPAIAAGIGSANFSWNYEDLEGDSERFFHFQISSSNSVDADGSFVSPEVDRSYDGLYESSGAQNLQQVNITPSLQADSLTYNTTYYWQVKVCQHDSGQPQDFAFIDETTGYYCSDWQEGLNFTTPAHAYPWPAFAYSNTSPAVNFTDISTCYDGDATCNTYGWDFGDGETSTIKSPTHSYEEVGSYNVGHTVTDGDGYSCQVMQMTGAPNLGGSSLPFWRETNPGDFDAPVANGTLLVSLITTGEDDIFSLYVNSLAHGASIHDVATVGGFVTLQLILNGDDTYTTTPINLPPGWSTTGNTCGGVFVPAGGSEACSIQLSYGGGGGGDGSIMVNVYSSGPAGTFYFHATDAPVGGSYNSPDYSVPTDIGGTVEVIVPLYGIYSIVETSLPPGWAVDNGSQCNGVFVENAGPYYCAISLIYTP